MEREREKGASNDAPGIKENEPLVSQGNAAPAEENPLDTVKPATIQTEERDLRCSSPNSAQDDLPEMNGNSNVEKNYVATKTSAVQTEAKWTEKDLHCSPHDLPENQPPQLKENMAPVENLSISTKTTAAQTEAKCTDNDKEEKSLQCPSPNSAENQPPDLEENVAPVENPINPGETDEAKLTDSDNKEQAFRCSSPNIIENEPPEIEGNVELVENPVISIESPPVQAETKSTDNNEEQVPSFPPTSNDNLLSPNSSPDEGQTSKPKMIRSTSLKSTNSSKSPQPKIVRFADALGLDLTDVRTFQKHGLPNISPSAFADLQVPQNRSSTVTIPRRSRPTLVPMFPQPGVHPQFVQTIHRNKVSLENVRMVDNNVLQAIVRVANLGFEKEVRLIYTRDGWETQLFEIGAFVSQDPVDKSSDRFKVDVVVPNLTIGERLVFVIRYVVNEREFWDNNHKRNYVMECVSDSSIVRPFW